MSQTSAPTQAETLSPPMDIHYAVPTKRFSKKKDEGLWLMSFSDMSMILISFFILQLSFSTINQQKADILREAVQTKKFEAKQDSMTSVSKRINNEIKRLNLVNSAQVTTDTTGVLITDCP